MFNSMIETLKANPRSIVFTEGHDARILEATARLKAEGFLKVILVGNVDEVKANAAKNTLLRRAMRLKAAQEQLAEEIRILYVAMTRARERLILIGEVAGEEPLPRWKNAGTPASIRAIRSEL